GPHDTQYFMENPEQAFVEYTSSRTDEAGGLVSEFMESQDTRLSKFEADFKQQQSKMTNKIDTVLKAITDRIAGRRERQPEKPFQLFYTPDPSISFLTEKVLKFTSLFESLGLVPLSPNVELVCTKEEDGDMMFIEIIPKDDDSRKEEPEVEGATTKEPVVEYFDIFLPRDELTYHRKLNPREGANRGISNFTRRIKQLHVFIGNFTYVIDFMIAEDISLILDPRLSQVVPGRPFIEISNMTHDPPEGVVRFIRGTDEVAYKMPHKIEQYDSLSNLEKEHTKSVYLRNEEDKRRGVECVMSKILGFYKECLELGPEYLTGIDNDGEVT
nr:retrotransposon Orf1 [Tanacetum cinerariifolium]